MGLDVRTFREGALQHDPGDARAAQLLQLGELVGAADVDALAVARIVVLVDGGAVLRDLRQLACGQRATWQAAGALRRGERLLREPGLREDVFRISGTLSL